MIKQLNEQQRQRIAVAILAITVAFILSLTALPIYVANASRQTALDDAQERLVRYQQIAKRDLELLPQYQALRNRQKAAGNHLRSDTVAVAGAELQRLVKQIAARHEARIISTQILPASNEEGFVRVALRVRLSGVLPAVLQSVYDLETDEVHMFLDNLSLRASSVGLRQRQAKIPPMDAEFDLIAYMPEES